MANRKLALTGSERAEFEHLHGNLTSDPQDPRFVLVDDETFDLVAETPPGIPVRPSQAPSSKRDIEAVTEKVLAKRGITSDSEAASEDLPKPKTATRARAEKTTDKK